MTYVVEYWTGGQHNQYELDKIYIKSATAYVSDREGDAEMEVIENSGATQRLKKNGAKWLLHCLSGPAFETDIYFEYYVDGERFAINNMPLSAEEKCILVLKYGDLCRHNNYVYTK